MELGRGLSPYICGNSNPIRFIDPDGMWLDDEKSHLKHFMDSCIVKKSYNSFGIAKLRILKSNVKMYHPRQKDNYYGMVEIYDIHVRAMSLGDTIKIDTKKKVICCINDGEIEKGTTIVNTDEHFYNYIKKYHEKF